MSVTNSKSAESSASFIVGKVSGEGYRITSSSGPFVDELAPQVLPVLEMLGPVLSKSSVGQIHWLGPFKNSHYLVGIHCRILETGNTEYYQTWFPDSDPPTQTGTSIGFLIASCLLALALGAGGVLAIALKPRFESTIESKTLTGVNPTKSEPMEGQDVNANKRLRSTLEKNRPLRQDLKRYLSQDGFSFDPSLPVVTVKRSVKITSDLDQTPPDQESIKLSNVQVQQLLELLAELAICEEKSDQSQNDIEAVKPGKQK